MKVAEGAAPPAASPFGREHDEVVGYRAQWEALLAEDDHARFALPADDPLEALHAPPLPNARMVKRGP